VRVGALDEPASAFRSQTAEGGPARRRRVVIEGILRSRTGIRLETGLDDRAETPNATGRYHIDNELNLFALISALEWRRMRKYSMKIRHAAFLISIAPPILTPPASAETVKKPTATNPKTTPSGSLKAFDDLAVRHDARKTPAGAKTMKPRQ
jgi:hypothetical protein